MGKKAGHFIEVPQREGGKLLLIYKFRIKYKLIQEFISFE